MEELEGLFEELKGVSDRAAGILAAAHLEVEIEGLLSDRFVPLDLNDADMIFGTQGFLSAAMAKVRLAYALGIFGSHTKAACVTIFDFRNMFAHAPRSVDFSTNAIKNKCDVLNIIEIYAQQGLEKGTEGKPANTREKYIFECYTVFLNVKKLRIEKILQQLDVARQEIRGVLEKTTDKSELRDAIKKMEVFKTAKPLLP